MGLHEAQYYEDISEESIQCSLCPYNCSISPSRHGQCGVRVNRDGTLYAKTYARVSTEQVIPIEDVSLYHFHPGARVLLVGSLGCTMRCPFCITWRVSQAGARTTYVSPRDLVQKARREGVQGVAFGVNEPVLSFEYILEAGRLLHEANLFVVMGTNGFISTTPLLELLSLVDALVVDVKGPDETFHQEVCGGYREEILRNIVTINTKRHLEVSTIIIQEHNDDEKELEEFFRWIKNLQPHAPPLHLIQFKPAFQYRNPPTAPLRMYYLQEMARRILPHVYLSNMMEREGNTTYCPGCKTPLIIREKGQTDISKLAGNKCINCGAEIILVR